MVLRPHRYIQYIFKTGIVRRFRRSGSAVRSSFAIMLAPLPPIRYIALVAEFVVDEDGFEPHCSQLQAPVIYSDTQVIRSCFGPTLWQLVVPWSFLVDAGWLLVSSASSVKLLYMAGQSDIVILLHCS